ncbi:MAG: class I SAM-dependent methyltransferase [Stackebrandtia sp.]
MNDNSQDPQQLRSYMYGPGNLGGLTIFSGGFINYGYWPSEIDDSRPLTVDERTASQANLYREVAARLDAKPDSRLLEIGCGTGAGAALIAREHGPAALLGLDLSAEQLFRAASDPGTGSPSYLRGSAIALPVADGSLDAVYCVEAAQHFDDHRGFAVEARRVLRPGGRFVVAGFFAPTGKTDPRLAELLETVGNGIDIVAPIEGFTGRMRDAGFAEVTVESIGSRVWEGLDAWIAQTEHHDTWGRNWLPAYQSGWVDYYLVQGAALGRVGACGEAS